ncbi:MAG: hypothetical protein L3J74_18610, partial [Bacteroidales bacterium]|nr:hypothetical protein [Bacteroidales bacterium]
MNADKLKIETKQLYYCPMHCEGDKTYKEPGNCPVCNMKLVSSNKHAKHEHTHKNAHEHSNIKKNKESEIKYFCPMLCEGDKTYSEPGDCPVCGMHLKTQNAVKKTNTAYTCPMHSEINLPEPGDCPKCGMTLVPITPSDDSPEEKEYKVMLKRFLIAVIFTLPVFLIAMLDMVQSVHLEKVFPVRVWNWIQLLLSIPVIFYAGGTFFKRGISSIRRRSFN